MKHLYTDLNLSTSNNHDFVLSNGNIEKVNFNQRGLVDITDAETYIAISTHYLLNEGYKNYAHRLISILKCMGYTFGGNLATNTSEAIKIEKDYLKQQKISNNQNDILDATEILNAPIITLEQSKVIKYKINLSDRNITLQDRNAVKRYDLFEQINIIDLTPENILDAINIKNSKLLINKLILLAKPLHPSIERANLEYVLNYSDFSDIIVNSSENPIMHHFYNLNKSNKIIFISYIISYLNVLGFVHGLFDVEYVTPDKQALVDYVTKNRITIEKICLRKFTNFQLTVNGIIRWLNYQLKLFRIKIYPCSKDSIKNSKYFIDSPWRIIIKDGLSEVAHHPLEIDFPWQNYIQAYDQIIVNLKSSIPKFPKSSKGERECSKQLMSLDIIFYREHPIIDLPGRRFDFIFCYNNKTYILEYDGRQHFDHTQAFDETFKEFKEKQKIDISKTKKAIEYNCTLIRIDYTQFNNIKDHIIMALKTDKSLYISNSLMYKYITDHL